MKTYDIIIVRAGPGALTAGIYAGRQGTKTLILDKGLAGGIGREVPLMENYPGFDTISGFELVEKMKLQCMKYVELHENEIVKNIEKNNDNFLVTTHKDEYCGKTIILATGSSHKHLEIPGEEEYLGKGVSYCATCDARLYRGRKVAVIGYSDDSAKEAEFLSEIVSEVLFFPMKKGVVPEARTNIKIINEIPREISGEKHASGVVTDENEYVADCVFVLRDSVLPDTLVPGLETDGSHIKVDLQMRTNISGVFACGDIAGKPYQYIKAAGQGNVAALSAVEYLSHTSKNNS